MIDFPRSKNKTRQLLLTPLIDVVFLLLIFFMITTSFVQSESMELMLPSAADPAKQDSGDIMNIYVANDGALYLGQHAIPEVDLTDVLQKQFQQVPNQRVLLRSADQVSVQKLVSIMDLIYLSGGRSLAVADWK